MKTVGNVKQIRVIGLFGWASYGTLTYNERSIIALQLCKSDAVGGTSVMFKPRYGVSRCEKYGISSGL